MWYDWHFNNEICHHGNINAIRKVRFHHKPNFHISLFNSVYWNWYLFLNILTLFRAEDTHFNGNSTPQETVDNTHWTALWLFFWTSCTFDYLAILVFIIQYQVPEMDIPQSMYSSKNFSRTLCKFKRKSSENTVLSSTDIHVALLSVLPRELSPLPSQLIQLSSN